jgi:hypothetical protein
MWIRNLFDCLKSRHSRTSVQRPPAPCRLAVEALEDRAVPASLSVGDVTIVEGAAGTQNAAVEVRLSALSNKTVTVNYNTANGTALAGSDYDAVSGKLTFARGQTSKTILVPVCGDMLVESNESFLVKLSGAKNASIADGQGMVTILNDDPTRPTISISDASVWGGDPATTFMTFTVSLAAAYDEPVTVNYATQDDAAFAETGYAAIAGQDYLAISGTLTFAPGETTKTIAVEIFGVYGTPEFNEWFFVTLSGASANALITDGEGVGWIGGGNGPMPEPFDGTNTYQATRREASETFYLDLFGLNSNALFTKNRGLGTIVNDD